VATPTSSERRPSGVWFLLGALLVGSVGVVIILVVFPTQNASSRSATLDAPPATVYALLSDVQQYPSWQTGVERVELLGDDGSGPRFREYREAGAITYRIETAELNTQFRLHIEDDAVPFGGSRTFDLVEGPTGTELTILEAGHAFSEVFQLLSVAGFATPGMKEQLLTDLRSALRSPREQP
jgi:uncharacterized protein YndB with AHSA1/START domain